MRGVARGIAVFAVCAAAGCGGASSGGAGGHAGGGSGGQGGAAGGGGGAAGAGAGGSSNLPACALVTRPADPDGGAAVDTLGGTCNSIVFTAPTLTPEPLQNGPDGGVSVDGGPEEGPVGGTILDGDYQLVRYQNNGAAVTQRQLRVFGGGTYIEWAIHQPEPTTVSDSGVADLRFDTSVTTGTSGALTLNVSCGSGVDLSNFFYTASGNTLVFFDIGQNNIGRIVVLSVDTFERTCTR